MSKTDQNTYLLKYSPTGDVIWQRSFGKNNSTYGAAHSLVLSQDQTRLCLNRRNVDNGGTLLPGLSAHQFATHVFQTEDGGHLGSVEINAGNINEWDGTCAFAPNNDLLIARERYFSSVPSIRFFDAAGIGSQFQPLAIAEVPDNSMSYFFVRVNIETQQVAWAKKALHQGANHTVALHKAIVYGGQVYWLLATTVQAFPSSQHHGAQDLAVAVLDLATGTFINGIQIGTSLSEWAQEIAVDETGVYLYGHTAGALAGPSAGSNDAVLMKLSLNLTSILWSRQYGSSADDKSLTGGLNLTEGSLWLSHNLTGAIGNIPAPSGADAVLIQANKQTGAFINFGTSHATQLDPTGMKIKRGFMIDPGLRYTSFVFEGLSDSLFRLKTVAFPQLHPFLP